MRTSPEQVKTRQGTVNRRNAVAGFTVLELLVVVVIVLIVAAMAIPSIAQIAKSYTLSSTAHSLAAMINEAKLRAGSDFTLARLNCTDMTSSVQASCLVEVCTVKGATPGSCTTWTTDQVAQPLPQNMTFQLGTISTVPADSTQTTPAETLKIYFNSRGVPIDVSGTSPVPTGGYVLYVKDSTVSGNNNTYAVVLTLSGRTTFYSYQNGWSQL